MAYVSKTSTKSVILSELNSIMDFYVARGFNIPDVHADIKFACVTNDTLATRINNTAADDHVGEMERSIYTTNNGVRSMTHVLPFKRIPKVNDDWDGQRSDKEFQPVPGIEWRLQTISTLTIMTGRSNPD